jgi:hypothetical protein
MSDRVRLSILVTVAVVAVLFLWASYNKAPYDKALMLSLTGGILAGGWVYLFYYTGRRSKHELKGPTNSEQIKMQGAGSHFHDGEEVGGTLFLVGDELVFQSHTFSLRKHEMRIPLKEIQDVKLFEKYGHREGGLKIILHNGQMIRFGSRHASRWMERIEEETINPELL